MNNTTKNLNHGHNNLAVQGTNVLYNPSFGYNKRANSEYNLDGFTIDGWVLSLNGLSGSLEHITQTGITVTLDNTPGHSHVVEFSQKDVSQLLEGAVPTIQKASSTDSGHSHLVILQYNGATDVISVQTPIDSNHVPPHAATILFSSTGSPGNSPIAKLKRTTPYTGTPISLYQITPRVALDKGCTFSVGFKIGGFGTSGVGANTKVGTVTIRSGIVDGPSFAESSVDLVASVETDKWQRVSVALDGQAGSDTLNIAINLYYPVELEVIQATAVNTGLFTKLSYIPLSREAEEQRNNQLAQYITVSGDESPVTTVVLKEPMIGTPVVFGSINNKVNAVVEADGKCNMVTVHTQQVNQLIYPEQILLVVDPFITPGSMSNPPYVPPVPATVSGLANSTAGYVHSATSLVDQVHELDEEVETAYQDLITKIKTLLANLTTYTLPADDAVLTGAFESLNELGSSIKLPKLTYNTGTVVHQAENLGGQLGELDLEIKGNRDALSAALLTINALALLVNSLNSYVLKIAKLLGFGTPGEIPDDIVVGAPTRNYLRYGATPMETLELYEKVYRNSIIVNSDWKGNALTGEAGSYVVALNGNYENLVYAQDVDIPSLNLGYYHHHGAFVGKMARIHNLEIRTTTGATNIMPTVEFVSVANSGDPVSVTYGAYGMKVYVESGISTRAEVAAAIVASQPAGKCTCTTSTTFWHFNADDGGDHAAFQNPQFAFLRWDPTWGWAEGYYFHRNDAKYAIYLRDTNRIYFWGSGSGSWQEGGSSSDIPAFLTRTGAPIQAGYGTIPAGVQGIFSAPKHYFYSNSALPEY